MIDAGIGLALPYNWQRSAKRLMDVLGAGIGLVLCSPVFLIILALIQIETPGKAFFWQERVGLGGKCFRMLKFRTMRDFPEQALEDYFMAKPEAQAEYVKYQKITRDPRVTRLGGFLRRSSLDELPQLWNVLKGEMSLVGPRPFLPGQLKLYGKAYRYYQLARPGLTGLWQVSGRNQLPFQERAALDQRYIQTWSIWQDLAILLLTPWAVLLQIGAL